MSRNADPLNLVRPEVPAELAALVAKMMAKDPAPTVSDSGGGRRGTDAVLQERECGLQEPETGSLPGRPDQCRTAGDGLRRAGCQGTECVRAAVREPRWESLIEIPGPKPANEPEPAAAAKRRPPRSWRPVSRAGGCTARPAASGDRHHDPRLWGHEGNQLHVGAGRQDTARRAFHPNPAEVGGREGKVTQQVDKTSPVVPSTPASPKSLVNSIGMTLKLDPPGEFDMGTSPEEMEAILQIPDVDRKQCSFEQPRHHVRITRPFYLGATEVTRGQFKRFVEAEGYQTEAERSGGGMGWNGSRSTFEGYSPTYHWRYPGFEQTNEHPVLNVSWNDAVALCGWLSRTEKVVYRLPTEAEWEYACRAGTTSLYGSGIDPESLVRVGNLWDKTLLTKYPHFLEHWVCKAPSYFKASDDYVYTAPVAQFQPNGFALYDMLGNVGEWCNDWFDADYYNQSPVDDPPGPSRQ